MTNRFYDNAPIMWPEPVSGTNKWAPPLVEMKVDNSATQQSLRTEIIQEHSPFKSGSRRCSSTYRFESLIAAMVSSFAICLKLLMDY
jgi:hypothetical protein